MTTEQLIARLDSIEAYAEGLIMEVQNFKKEIAKGQTIKTKAKPISDEEMRRATARFRHKMLMKSKQSSD